MGRPINNIRKGSIRTKINKAGYKKLIALGHTVVLKMTGNANFTTPVPALATLTTAANDLKASTIYMGLKRNRGSKAEQQAATLKANQLRDVLTQLLHYVENTATTMAAGDNVTLTNILASSGYGLSNVRSVKPQAQIATFVQQVNTKKYPGSVGRLKWKRPLGLIKGAKVAGYNIISGGKIILTTTKTNINIPVTPGVNTDVIIVPFNSKGSGQPFNATVKGMS